jgi:hypothetical protein
MPALAAQLSTQYAGNIGAVIHRALPRALDVARIAARQLLATGIDGATRPEHAAPLYLRNKVAMTIDERREHHAAKVGQVS